MSRKRLPARDNGNGTVVDGTPTMADVARAAGLSIATVSRVLSGRASVAPDYRARVVAAVAALGYRPNRLARNLRRNSTDMIGIVISDIENAHFSEMTHVAEEEAYRRGYRVLLCNTDESGEKQASYLQMLAAERPLGVILSPCDSNGREIGELLDLGIPIVAFDRPVDDPRADAVLADNFEASRMAVEHLFECGRRRIGYLGISTQIETGARRLAGYRAALADVGLEPHWEDGGLRLMSGQRAAERLLGGSPDLDAMIVGNNMLTPGALRVIRAAGRKVPGDIAMVAFDDPFWAELIDPPLTTLAQPVRSMTATAVRLLLDSIEGRRREPERIVFRFTLKVRGSSPGVIAAKQPGTPAPS